jgi:hypothetical protein
LLRKGEEDGGDEDDEDDGKGDEDDDEEDDGVDLEEVGVSVQICLSLLEQRLSLHTQHRCHHRHPDNDKHCPQYCLWGEILK